MKFKKKTTDSKYINPNFINSYLVTLGGCLLASGLFSVIVLIQVLFITGILIKAQHITLCVYE